MKTDKIFNQLNQAQQQAVTSNSQIIRVIAGAGSGKTRVLVARIIYLIQQGVLPHKICAITFTNKAANEMKERIKKSIDDLGSGVWLSTIHSLCVRILREDIQALNYPRNFTIVDATDQKSILKEAYKEFGIDVKEFPYSSLLNYISNNKGADISIQQAYDLAGSDRDEILKAKTYEYYQNRLTKMYALDFDDLLLFTVRLFKQASPILAKWQHRFDAILVDEFQDIDHVQYTLIKQLVGSQNQLFVVGDPDQTIYTWRGADVNIILDFAKRYPKCETVVLNQNYRSTQMILAAANSLIKHNKYRQEKESFTENHNTDKVLFINFNSGEAQANWIGGQINELIQQDVPLSEIAILYRSNYLSRNIEKALMLASIPYVITGGVRFYDRAEIKDVLSYLRMCVIKDDLSLIRTINVPKRGIGEKTIDKIRQEAARLDCSMYQVIKNHQLFSGSTAVKLMGYIELIEKLTVYSDELELDQLMTKIIDETGLRQFYTDSHELDRVENIKELINDANSFMNTFEEANLDDYLASVALYGDKNEQVNSAVSLMTIHAAKGLEFDHVFICDLTEGIFPNERAMSDSVRGIEEERRLAYVAITRAKQQLYLTCALGFSYVLNQSMSPSRFIDEIDAEVLEIKQLNSYGQVIEKQSFSVVKEQLTSKVKYKKGDVVIHTLFGEGVVLSVDNSLGRIAFNHPYGIKTLNLFHQSLSKKQEDFHA